jgi:hypothetical protein
MHAPSKHGINHAIGNAARAYYEAWLDADDAEAIEAMFDATIDTALERLVADQHDEHGSYPGLAVDALNAAADAYTATRRTALEHGATSQTADEAARAAAIAAYYQQEH